MLNLARPMEIAGGPCIGNVVIDDIACLGFEERLLECAYQLHVIGTVIAVLV